MRSGQLFNFVGIVPAHEVHRESWTDTGDLDDLRASFEGCNPTLGRIIDAVDVAFLTGFYDRAPLPAWTSGRVTLIGDAAHPMQPFLAQGACQAMEDAACLAACLARHGRAAAAEALAEYEQRRRPRATRTQAVAAGSEQTWHETDEARIRARNGRFRGIARVDPLTETVWGWLYHHDPVGAADVALEDVLGLTATRIGRVRDRDVSHRAHELWASMLTPGDLARGVPGLRDAYERFLGQFPPPPGTDVEEIDADGVAALSVLAPGAAAEGPLVLHLHGGGYVVGSAKGSLDYAARLSAAVGGPVLVPSYRLAPEHPFPAALEDTRRALRWAHRQGPPGRSVVLSGESAGGGLAVAAAVAARDAGEPLPRLIFVVSPFADLSVSGGSVDAEAGRDPVATRDLLVTMSASYLQGHDPADPAASPIYADLSGLPPLFVTCAENEALADDARRLAAAAEAAGVSTRFRPVPDSVHVFPIFPFLPEAKEVFEELRSRVDGVRP